MQYAHFGNSPVPPSQDKAFYPMIKSNPFNHRYHNNSGSLFERKRKTILKSQTQHIARRSNMQKVHIGPGVKMIEDYTSNPQKQIPTSIIKLLSRKTRRDNNFMGHRVLHTQASFQSKQGKTANGMPAFQQHTFGKDQQVKTTKRMGIKVLYEKYRRNIKNKITSPTNKQFPKENEEKRHSQQKHASFFYVDSIDKQQNITVMMKSCVKKKRSEIIYQQQINRNFFRSKESKNPSRLSPWGTLYKQD